MMNGAAEQNSSDKKRWPLLLVAAAAGTFLATSCGAIAENVAEEAVERAVESEGADVEIDFDDDGGTFTVETDEGSVVVSGDDDGASVEIESEDGSGTMNIGESAEVPDCINDVFDVPDDMNAESTLEGDGFCMLTGFVSDGTLEDYADKYEADLKSSGYDADFSRSGFESDGFESISLTSMNADGQLANVSINAQDDFSSISGGDNFWALVFTFQVIG